MRPPLPQSEDHWAKVIPASSVHIRTLSYGVIKSSRLMDETTERFHEAGLFSERIFGPIANYRCACGKYQHPDSKGVVCDECGVLVGSRDLRTQRFGHIELKLPVIHPWWYGKESSPVELLSELSPDEVQAIRDRKLTIRFDYDTSVTEFIEMPLVGVDYYAVDEKTEYVTGARAIQQWLAWLTDDSREQRLRACYDNRQHLTPTELRQLRLLSSLSGNDVYAAEFVLEAIPVIPAALRRIDIDCEGRLVVDPVTRCYQRIASTDRAISKLLAKERVDLPQRIDPLTEQLCGLERRMRRLVKRLFAELLAGTNLRGPVFPHLPDRSVIPKRRIWPGSTPFASSLPPLVPDPSLQINECRIPPDMARELWSQRLASNDTSQEHSLRIVHDSVMQHRLTEKTLDVMSGNKQTLVVVPPVDRLGRLLALKTRPTGGNAIHIHPSVASLFETTFDGTSAAGWHPDSLLAHDEINEVSPRQFLRKIANGHLQLKIPDEALLGCYLATWESREQQVARYDVFGPKYNLGNLVPKFLSADDARIAYESGYVSLTDPVVQRLPPQSLVADYDCHSPKTQLSPDARCTTVGRVLLNGRLPDSLPFLDLTFGQREAEFAVTRVLESDGAKAAMRLVERLTEFGLEMLTRSGLSLSFADLSPPPDKAKRLAEAEKDTAKTQKYYDRGILCSAEVHARTYDIWSHAKSQMADDINRRFEEEPTAALRMMAHGLRKVRQKHLEQLTTMIGPVPGFHDGFPYVPIKGNFTEGLTVHEYCVTARQARSNRVSEVLARRDASRLQRRITNSMQNVVITEADCGTPNGICKRAPGVCDHHARRFSEQISGRVSRETVVDPYSEETIVAAGYLISSNTAERLESLGVERLEVRSPLGCTARRGICQSCYGADLRTGELVERGTAVGGLSAFAIGELLPQLRILIRRFGGLPMHGTTEGELRSKHRGTVSLKQLDLAITPQGQRVTLAAGKIAVNDHKQRVLEEFDVPEGSVIVEAAGNNVSAGTLLAKWNPAAVDVYTKSAGVVVLDDLIPGRNMHLDENATAAGVWRIDEELRGRRPRLRVEDITKATVDFCFLPKDSRLYALPGQMVERGTLLARIPTVRETDLDWHVGGFPRVEELLLARDPKYKAILSQADGIVEVTTIDENQCCTIQVYPTDPSGEMTGEVIVHSIDLTRTGRLLVRQKDQVKAGQRLTDGERAPRDLLKILGLEAIGEYLLFELQKCFRGQVDCIDIDDRHFEVIISEMLSMVRVDQPGDTGLQRGDRIRRSAIAALNQKVRGLLKVEEKGDSSLPDGGLVSHRQFELEVRRLEQTGGDLPTHSLPWPAGGIPVLLGIDQIARRRNDFYTAAGLSMTQPSLALSALTGRRYNLRTLSGSIATGELVPCGTGWQDEEE